MPHRSRQRAAAAKGEVLPKDPFDADGSFRPTDPDNPLGDFSVFEQKVLRLKFENRNLSQGQLALLLGVAPDKVSKTFTRPQLAAVAAWLDRDLYSKITEMQHEALTVNRGIMLDQKEPSWLRAQIARDFYMEILRSKLALPPPPAISALHFEDGPGDSKPEVVRPERKGPKK